MLFVERVAAGITVDDLALVTSRPWNCSLQPRTQFREAHTKLCKASLGTAVVPPVPPGVVGDKAPAAPLDDSC